MANLAIRLLGNVRDINHYQVVPYAKIHEGEDYSLYFQFVDPTQACEHPSGGCDGARRYVPGGTSVSSAIATISFSGLDNTSTIAATVAGISYSQAWTTTLLITVQALAAKFIADANLATLGATFTSSSSGPTSAVINVTRPGMTGNGVSYSSSIVAGAGTTSAAGFLSGGAGNGSALCQVKVLNIDDALVITRFADQPFPNLDPTIWRVQLLNTDPIPAGTANLRGTLFETMTNGTQLVSSAYVAGAFRVYSTKQNSTQPGGLSSPGAF